MADEDGDNTDAAMAAGGLMMLGVPGGHRALAKMVDATGAARRNSGESVRQLTERLKQKYPTLTNLRLVEEPDGTLAFDRIDVSPRGQGVGTKVLEEITAWADQHGKTITGVVDMKNRRRILRWYQRHGFTPAPDFDPWGEITRRPVP